MPDDGSDIVGLAFSEKLAESVSPPMEEEFGRVISGIAATGGLKKLDVRLASLEPPRVCRVWAQRHAPAIAQ